MAVLPKQNPASGGPGTEPRWTRSRVTVRMIRTDEERMIAEIVCRVLGME